MISADSCFLSIGRDDNVVKNVYIANNNVINSDQAVRIKTVSGATGSVSK